MLPAMSQKVPFQKCPACGSTWFREAAFLEYIPRRDGMPEWFGLLDDDQDRGREMTILVCLCGEPITPPLTAGAWSTTRQTIRRLLQCLERAQAQSNALEQAKTVLQTGGIGRPELKALQPRLRKLKNGIGRQLARQDVAAGRRKPRGRHWQPSEAPLVAQPESGTKGRAWLGSQIQHCGLTAREAQAALEATLEAIKKGLQQDGFVQTPLGEFYTASRTMSYQRKRPAPQKGTGPKEIYEQTLHEQRTCVRFKPDPGWIGKGEIKQ